MQICHFLLCEYNVRLVRRRQRETCCRKSAATFVVDLHNSHEKLKNETFDSVVCEQTINMQKIAQSLQLPTCQGFSFSTYKGHVSFESQSSRNDRKTFQNEIEKFPRALDVMWGLYEKKKLKIESILLCGVSNFSRMFKWNVFCLQTAWWRLNLFMN